MERLWSTMSRDVMGLVFSKLREPCLRRAGGVCKGWNTMATDFFECESTQASSPRCVFFRVYGVKYSLTCDRGYYHIQAVEDGDCVSMVSCDDDDIPCAEAAGGLIYAFKRTKVQYKLSHFDDMWRVTSDIPCLMRDPVVGVVVKSGGSGSRDHKLIFAGGETYHLEDGDDLAVWVYDALTNSWETCESLPDEFSGNTSSLCMGSVVHRGMFYVYDRNSGRVCQFDTNSKTWSKVQDANPPADVKELFLVSVHNRLCLVGVLDGDQRDISFNVWRVDEDSTEVAQLLHSKTVANCRAPVQSELLKRTSRSLEPLAGCVGVLLIVLLYLMRLCNSVTVKIARRMSSIAMGRSVNKIESDGMHRHEHSAVREDNQ